jgi:hypothetical protein
LGETIDIDFVLWRVLVKVERHETWVDLLPLELQDFDVIFWMDWLSIHRAWIDYFAKFITLRALNGVWVVSREEMNVVSNWLISIITT